MAHCFKLIYNGIKIEIVMVEEFSIYEPSDKEIRVIGLEETLIEETVNIYLDKIENSKR